MSNKRIEDIIKEKLESKQYAYDDAYWDSAKDYIASQKKGKKGFFYSLSFILILFTIVSVGAFSVWYFTPADSSSKLTEATSLSSSSEVATDQSKSNESKNLITNRNTSSIASEGTHLDDIQQIDNRSNQSISSTRTSGESEALDSENDDFNLTSDNSNSIIRSTTADNKSSSFSKNSSSDLSSLEESKVNRDLFEILHLELKDIEQFNISPDVKNERKNEFSLPKLNLFAVGIYGSYQWMNDLETNRYSISNATKNSYGALGEYAINSWIHLQAGAGYSTEQFNLKVEPDFTINQFDDWDITTNTNVIYNMQFQNGVPVEFDSSVVTTVDSTLITSFDTTYTDSIFTTLQGNYRINRIEIPLAIRFHKSFGRWEIYGATGANLGILTHVAIQQSELSFPNEEEFNRFSMNGTFRIGAAMHITDKLRWSLGGNTNYELIQPIKFVEQRRLLYGLHSSLIYRW